MTSIWRFAALSIVSVLIVVAFIGGWALSPDSTPFASSAAGISSDSGASTNGAGSIKQDPQDEMTQLCARHMTETRPLMDEMMGEGMMPGMMER